MSTREQRLAKQRVAVSRNDHILAFSEVFETSLTFCDSVNSFSTTSCRATSYKTYVLINVLYTVLSALPVVSHVVPLFLEPCVVSQVLTFFEAFPLSPGYSVHPFLRCRSTLLNVHEYYYTMTCLLKRNKLHYCLTNVSSKFLRMC